MSLGSYAFTEGNSHKVALSDQAVPTQMSSFEVVQRGAAAGDPAYRLDEVADVLELAVDAGEAHVGDLVDLAKLLHSSQSRVAKMEGGDPSVSIDLLVRSLLALGASSRDLARAISGASLPKASCERLSSPGKSPG